MKDSDNQHDELPTGNNPSSNETVSHEKRPQTAGEGAGTLPKKAKVSSVLSPSSIQIEMNSFSQNDTRVSRTALLQNDQIEKFLNSLDYHKAINRKASPLAAKTVFTDGDDMPAPEEEDSFSLNVTK